MHQLVVQHLPMKHMAITSAIKVNITQSQLAIPSATVANNIYHMGNTVV